MTDVKHLQIGFKFLLNISPISLQPSSSIKNPFRLFFSIYISQFFSISLILLRHYLCECKWFFFHQFFFHFHNRIWNISTDSISKTVSPNFKFRQKFTLESDLGDVFFGLFGTYVKDLEFWFRLNYEDEDVLILYNKRRWRKQKKNFWIIIL